MSQVILEDANSQLARLVEQASRGEEIIILRDSTSVAKIVPLPEEKLVSHFGNAKDSLIYMADDMADDFDAPLECTGKLP